jgi:hypothetical protein
MWSTLLCRSLSMELIGTILTRIINKSRCIRKLINPNRDANKPQILTQEAMCLLILMTEITEIRR